MMKDHTKNEWKQFYPKTNIFWLHYLENKLEHSVKYKNKKSKTHRNKLSELRNLRDNILSFDSAKDFISWYHTKSIETDI